MKTNCAATIFHVSDVEASLKYYIQLLGFSLDFRYNDLAGVEYGSVMIYLSGPAQEVKQAIGQGSVYIFCDAVDEYFNDISGKGALISVTIDNRGYGMRDFAINDGDGNILTFGTQIK